VHALNDLIASLQATWHQIVAALPSVASAVLVLMLGWILARVARRLAVRLFRWMRVDAAAERLGVEGFLMKGGVEFTTVTLLGWAIYWGVLFVTFVALLNLLALPAGVALLERIVAYIPNVVVAVIVLIFGSVVSRFAGAVTHTYLSNVGSHAAQPIALIARTAVLVFVVAMAIEQLAIRSAILVSGFQIVFGAACLAIALAFGLGGREWAARVLERLWKP
jgi:hypothetical protein